MRVKACLSSERCAGSNVTARALLMVLARGGHEIIDAGPDPEAGWPGADIAVAHLDMPEELIANSRQYGVPLVVLFRSVGEARLVDARHVALAVFPSTTMALEAHWAGSWLAVPPPILVADYRVFPAPEHTRKVTLVNLSAGTGAAFLYELAGRMPGREFLGVQGCVGRQVPAPPLPNLEIVEACEDIRDVYARTRVLLMPGDQTYGRPAVEAACSGIPTIAHPSHPALEVLGRAAIWAPRERGDEWVRAIRRLDTPSEYQAASKAALLRAVQLDPTSDCHRFLDYVETAARDGRLATADSSYWHGA